MNLFFRLIRTLVVALFFSRRTLLTDAHTFRSAVWLGDHDLLGHMTNSRYASFTDLAIMNYLGRTGMLGVCRKNGWAPIVQHEAISFLKPMRFPQAFEIRSKLVCWDDVYLCFRHEFWSKGKLTAESRMVARLIGRNRLKVTDKMILEQTRQTATSPPMEPVFQAIIDELRRQDLASNPQNFSSSA